MSDDLKYKNRDCEDTIFSDQYADHVNAMTAESLHSKREIAAELAHRDIVIQDLNTRLEAAHGFILGTKEPWYSIENCGDGSAQLWLFATREEAEAHQDAHNADGNGWAEPCCGKLVLPFFEEKK